MRALFILTISIFTASCASEARRQLRAGDPVPSYEAVNLAGDTVSLASFRGRVVLLNLWATWCAPCRDETPFLQAKYEELAERGFEVVGVSMDARGQDEAIREFVGEFEVTYPILHDAENTGMALYRAIGLPASFLIDPDGRLRWMRYGPIAESNETFARALDDALAGRPIP